MARDHRAGGQVEPRVAWLGELLRGWLSHQSVSGARQLHSRAVAPVVALQVQGQATQGRDVSTLAPLRALRSRTADRTRVQRAMAEPVRHRQTKGAATDMFGLQPPRHISTLPRAAPPNRGPIVSSAPSV